MESDPPLPLLLRVPEVARELGCGRTHVYHLMDSGQLDYVKDGKFRRIPRQSLLAYIRRHTRRARGSDSAEAG